MDIMAGFLWFICAHFFAFYFSTYPSCTFSIDVILIVNTYGPCLQPMICRIGNSSQSLTGSVIISPNDQFALGKSVKRTQGNRILTSSLSSCSLGDSTNKKYNMCAIACSTLLMEHEEVFLHNLYDKNPYQNLFDSLLIGNKEWNSITNGMSAMLSYEKWTNYIIFTSSNEDVKIPYKLQYLMASVMMFTMHQGAYLNKTLDRIYSLLEKKDLNFVILCSVTCILEFLNQVYHYEASSEKASSRLLLIPTAGSLGDVINTTIEVPNADIAILDFTACTNEYSSSSLHMLPSLMSKFHYQLSSDINGRLTGYMNKTTSQNSSLVSATVYTLRTSYSIVQMRQAGHISTSGELAITEDLFPGMKYGFNNKTLTVATLEWPPFVIKEVVNGTVKYSGICINLLQELARILNFSYIIVEPEDQEWGRVLDGRWTGLIGQLAYKKIDLVVAPIAITVARENVMDFTTPYFFIQSGIILKNPDPNVNKWMTLVSPFRYEVHICIVLSLIFSTVFLFAVEEVHSLNIWADNSMSARRTRYGDILWYHFGALMANGGAYLPTTQTGRSVLSCWWLFTVISAAIYSGNLIAFLSDWRQKPPFTSLQEMVEQDFYKWGTVGGSAYLSLFQESNRSVFKKVWLGMLSGLDSTNLNLTVHKGMVFAGQYAYLGDETVFELWRSEQCDIQNIRDPFYLMNYAVGLPNNSVYTSVFSNQVLRINEIGLPRVWYKRWTRNSTIQCEASKSAKRVDLLALQSAFYAAGVGCLLSLSVLLSEMLYNRKYRQFVLSHQRNVQPEQEPHKAGCQTKM